MKIDDQSRQYLEQFHVAQQLRLRDRMKLPGGLYFDQQGTAHIHSNTEETEVNREYLCYLRCLLFRPSTIIIDPHLDRDLSFGEITQTETNQPRNRRKKGGWILSHLCGTEAVLTGEKPPSFFVFFVPFVVPSFAL